MTKGWKIGLSIAGVLGFCLLSGVIGIGYWVKTNGKQFIERQMNNARANVAEGETFGATTDQQGCLKEALLKLDGLSATDISGMLSNRFFFTGCLQASQATPNFCDGVPAPTEMMASVKWRAQKCVALKSKHQQCGNLLGEVQNFCAKAKTQRESDGSPPPQPNN